VVKQRLRTTALESNLHKSDVTCRSYESKLIGFNVKLETKLQRVFQFCWSRTISPARYLEDMVSAMVVSRRKCFGGVA